MFRDRRRRPQGTDYRPFCPHAHFSISLKPPSNQNPIKCFEIDGCGPKALITDHFAPTRISPSPSNLLQNQNPIKCFEIDGGGPKALITGHFVPTRISPSPSNLLQNQNPIKCFEIDGGGPKALITDHFAPTRISPSPSNLLQNQNRIKNLCPIGQICCARAIGVSMFDEAFLKSLSNYITCLS